MHADWGGRYGTVTTMCEQLARERERQGLTLARYPGTQTHLALHGMATHSFSVRTGWGAAVLVPSPHNEAPPPAGHVSPWLVGIATLGLPW